jgi:DnaJ-class molecular chaperone
MIYNLEKVRIKCSWCGGTGLYKRMKNGDSCPGCHGDKYVERDRLPTSKTPRKIQVKAASVVVCRKEVHARSSLGWS